MEIGDEFKNKDSDSKSTGLVIHQKSLKVLPEVISSKSRLSFSDASSSLRRSNRICEEEDSAKWIGNKDHDFEYSTSFVDYCHGSPLLYEDKIYDTGGSEDEGKNEAEESSIDLRNEHTVNVDQEAGKSAAKVYILGRLKRDPATAPICMKYVDLLTSEIHSDRYQTMIGIGDVPTSRTGFTLVYEQKEQKVILFGGKRATHIHDDEGSQGADVYVGQLITEQTIQQCITLREMEKKRMEKEADLKEEEEDVGEAKNESKSNKDGGKNQKNTPKKKPEKEKENKSKTQEKKEGPDSLEEPHQNSGSHIFSEKLNFKTVDISLPAPYFIWTRIPGPPLSPECYEVVTEDESKGQENKDENDELQDEREVEEREEKNEKKSPKKKDEKKGGNKSPPKKGGNADTKNGGAKDQKITSKPMEDRKEQNSILPSTSNGLGSIVVNDSSWPLGRTGHSCSLINIPSLFELSDIEAGGNVEDTKHYLSSSQSTLAMVVLGGIYTCGKDRNKKVFKEDGFWIFYLSIGKWIKLLPLPYIPQSITTEEMQLKERKESLLNMINNEEKIEGESDSLIEEKEEQKGTDPFEIKKELYTIEAKLFKIEKCKIKEELDFHRTNPLPFSYGTTLSIASTCDGSRQSNLHGEKVNEEKTDTSDKTISQVQTKGIDKLLAHGGSYLKRKIDGSINEELGSDTYLFDFENLSWSLPFTDLEREAWKEEQQNRAAENSSSFQSIKDIGKMFGPGSFAPSSLSSKQINTSDEELNLEQKSKPPTYEEKRNFTYEALTPTSWNTLVKVPRNLIDITAFPSLKDSINEIPAWQSDEMTTEDVVVLSIGGLGRNGDIYLLSGAPNVPWLKMATYNKGQKLPGLCKSHVGLVNSTLHIFGGYEEKGMCKEGGSYTNIWSCDLLGQDRPLDPKHDYEPFRMDVTYPEGNHYKGECAERAFIHKLERQEAENCGEDYLSSDEEVDERKNTEIEYEEKVKDEENEESLDIRYKKQVVEKRLRHGQGKMVYRNGDLYTGNWCKDYKHGFGVLHFMERNQQSTSISPETKSEEEKGSGEESNLKWENYSIAKYEGNFAMDQFNGEGKLETEVYFYEGTFQDGKRHGEGKCTWVMNDKLKNRKYKIIYEGSWKDDKMEGQGLKKFYLLYNLALNEKKPLLMSSWQGNFEKDLFREGREIHFDCGTVYEGTFGDGERKTGHGTIHYRNGNSFDGEWKENKKNGLGRYINKINGSIYDVKWVGNQIVGKGRINYSSGALYDGFVIDISDGLSSSTVQFRSPPPLNMFSIQDSLKVLENEIGEDSSSIDVIKDLSETSKDNRINNKIPKKELDTTLPHAESVVDSNKIAVPHGYGVMIYPPEDSIEEDENNIPNMAADAKYLYRYQGDFCKGKRHGRGKGYFKVKKKPDKVIMEGQWHNDSFIVSNKKW